MMHLPDAWGYIVFGKAKSSSHNGSDDMPKDSSWPVRLAAMNIYYAQAAFKKDHGTYASSIDTLVEENLVNTDITDPFDILIDLDDQGGYLVEVEGFPDGTTATITQDRYLRLDVGGKGNSS